MLKQSDKLHMIFYIPKQSGLKIKNQASSEINRKSGLA